MRRIDVIAIQDLGVSIDTITEELGVEATSQEFPILKSRQLKRHPKITMMNREIEYITVSIRLDIVRSVMFAGSYYQFSCRIDASLKTRDKAVNMILGP